MPKTEHRRTRTRGATHRRGVPKRSVTAIGMPAPTPHDALEAFMRRGRRDTLINELAREWTALGRSEVEDAVDEAVAEAARAMEATREAAVYDYLRTAAYRLLNRRKERAGRISAPVAQDLDFDRMVTTSLGPDDALIAKEHRQLILDIAASLDDRTLTILRLKHVEGLERKQVAETMGLSEKAVKKGIEKGHRICRELYRDVDSSTLCDKRRSAVDALIAGRASEAKRAEADAHLAHCESCRAYRRTLATATRAAAALAPLPITPARSGIL